MQAALTSFCVWPKASPTLRRPRVEMWHQYSASVGRAFSGRRLGRPVCGHAGRALPEGTSALEARILGGDPANSSHGSTHWSPRKLAAKLGLSHMRVARVWSKAGLQPHRVRSYMASDDPDFERKTADVIGLYLQPPTNAVVFCVDEKTAIQALDRLDPVLPLSPGRAERHGFEYFRQISKPRKVRAPELPGAAIARAPNRGSRAITHQLSDHSA